MSRTGELGFLSLGGFERLEFGERAAVFDRHHLAEHRAIFLPIGQDLGGCAIGEGKPADAIDVAVRKPRSDNSRYALACRHW